MSHAFKVGDLVQVLPGDSEADAGAIGRVVRAQIQTYGGEPYIGLEFADRNEWNVCALHLKRLGSRLFPARRPLTGNRL